MTANCASTHGQAAPEIKAVSESHQGKLPTGRLTAHALLHITVTGVHLPLSVYLPAIYAQQFGISLAALGVIFLAERIWGTATDPLVGWLCDRTRSRFGRRKVWIAAGSVLFLITSSLLFFPSSNATPVYLAGTLIVLFLAMSMIQIPYYAWSGELSGDYHERTRVASYQTMASGMGLFIVLFMPTLADKFYPGDQIMKLNAMGAAIILPVIPAVLLAFWAFPDRSAGAAVTRTAKVPLRQALHAVGSDRALIRVMLADFSIAFAQGLRGALFVFFVSFVAGKPEWASGLFLLQFIVGIFAAPIWQAIAKRFGKHRALIAAELGQAGVSCALIMVGLGDVALLLILTLIQGLMQGSGNMLLRAMLADIADEHELRTGVDRAAMLFSIFSISGKAGVALPIGMALPLIAWLGFDPQSTTNSSGALIGVAMLFSFGPGIAHLVGAILVRGFTLNETRQAEIRSELAARTA